MSMTEEDEESLTLPLLSLKHSLPPPPSSQGLWVKVTRMRKMMSMMSNGNRTMAFFNRVMQTLRSMASLPGMPVFTAPAGMVRE